jgi:tetratricopeptide (TPR) repeat protein
MQGSHLWITGTGRAGSAAAAAEHDPDFTVGCHRRLRGPYTGTGSLLRVLVPRIQASRPGLVSRHVIEILAVAPELEPLTGPAPQTLTTLVPLKERTRWYSRFQTRRIAHGIVDFLRECAEDGPLTIAFGSVGDADPTDVEFLSIALRRLDPARVRLIVCSAGEHPALDAVLSSYCERQAVTGDLDGAADPTPAQAAAAFIASDGTSDIPGEHEGYLRADPELRQRLHDERAAELASRDEQSLRLGAIPYHLEHGSASRTAARDAYTEAVDYCIGKAFYDAGLELTERLATLIDAEAEPGAYHLMQTQMCQCLALLDRSAETEAIYYDLLSRSTVPHRHMNVAYSLAMNYTRLYGPEHKDHRRALAHVNTAIAIASQLEDPADRAFHTVFMNNGKALIEMHLGHLEESLRLVSEGISRLESELPPERHRLHRSVLNHNRAQVLAGLGHPDEALAEFARVIDVDPNYPECRFDRAGLLCKLGRYAEAIADYEHAVRYTPPFPELFYNRGDARAALGDTAGARRDWEYVLDLEPDYVEARISLASLLLDEGDPEGAAEQARAGLMLSPLEAQQHWARLYCTLGLALLDLADHEAARQAFDCALDLDASLSAALVNRAVVACELGDYAAAIADLTTALETDARNPDLLYNRGFVQAAAGQLEDAIADYTLALADAEADHSVLLYQRGRCHAALGLRAAAHDDLAAHLALGDSPHEKEIHELLGV